MWLVWLQDQEEEEDVDAQADDELAEDLLDRDEL